MKNILIVCPRFRDRIDLPKLEKASEYRFIFCEQQAKELEKLRSGTSEADCLPHYTRMLEDLFASVEGYTIDGVITSDDYPGSIIASLIAQELKLHGPDPAVMLTLLHKYYSRIIQQDIAPKATPPFWLMTEGTIFNGSFPVFIKPVRASFSQYAGIMHSHEDIQVHITTQRPPKPFLSLFSQLLNDFTQFSVETDWFLLEDVLEGQQICLEGFAFDGEIQVLGLLDAHMYPGTMSFQRFEYPSALDDSVQLRICEIAKCVMSGAGFDNGFFNIEFIYDSKKDSVGIIEINPRIASQFADLFQKVDGENTYQMLLDIAVGNEPKTESRQGEFRYAASCVLRIFNDAYVERVPTASDMASIHNLFPEVHVELCCTKGKWLSQERQDGKSFRYALVHLGGNTRQELYEKLQVICAELNFIFRA